MKQSQGNIQNLLAAYDALMSIPAKNFQMTPDFGEPLKIAGNGRVSTVASPGGWLAQHPHFKEQGVEFVEVPLAGGIKRFMPTVKIIAPGETEENASRVRGYNALSRVLGLDIDTTHKVLSPAGYPEPKKVTPQDVAKKLRSVIVKIGGGDVLKEREKAIRAHQKAAEKAKSTPKKGAKKAKKARK